MKKELCLIIVSNLIGFASYAQLTPPEVRPIRPITDASMVIQFGGQKMEILPSLRAIRNESGTYTITNSDPSVTISNEKLGIAYSYSIASNILFNGEISIKLRPGYDASTLEKKGVVLNVLISPDLYVTTVTTPQDLVKWTNLLQAESSVQWVEPNIIKARLN